jgi:hypothetical protein
MLVGTSRESTIESCVFSENSATDGGALVNQGTLSLRRSHLFRNRASGAGGAIVNAQASEISIRACSLWENSSTEVGGALYNAGTSQLYNSTIASNSVLGTENTASGGGLFNASIMALKHCTVTLNSAPRGAGGIANIYRGTTSLNNTIVAANVSPTSADLAGVFRSHGFNLIGVRNGSSGPTQPTDKTGTADAPLNPQLVASQEGNNRFYVPGFSSPALDAGSLAASGSDQRNSARPVDFPDIANVSGGDGSDIGAIETGAGATPLPTPTPTRTPPPPPPF